MSALSCLWLVYVPLPPPMVVRLQDYNLKVPPKITKPCSVLLTKMKTDVGGSQDCVGHSVLRECSDAFL